MKKLILLLLITLISACDETGYQPNTAFIISPSSYTLDTPACGFQDVYYTLAAVTQTGTSTNDGISFSGTAGAVDFTAELMWSGNSTPGPVFTELYVDNGQVRTVIDADDDLVSAAGMPLYRGRTNSEGNAFFMVRFNTCENPGYFGSLSITTPSGLQSKNSRFDINTGASFEDDDG